MDKRRIGSLEVTTAGLGCNNFGWRIDAAATKQVVDAALDAGINFFDTANIYSKGESETYLGNALGHRRNDIVLATKFGHSSDETRVEGSAAYIRKALEDSLVRLKTDYVDLYQPHKPDPKTPIADVLSELDKLVREGKVREIGASNFTVDQIREAEADVASGAARFVSIQNNYSMFHRDDEPAGVLEACKQYSIAYLPFFPLANGLLTGKYRRGKPLPEGSRASDEFGPKVFTPENIDKVEELIAFTEQRGHTILELAFVWLLANPVIPSIIAGAKTPEQVKNNAAAVSWHLSENDLAEIDAILPAPAS